MYGLKTFPGAHNLTLLIFFEILKKHCLSQNNYYLNLYEFNETMNSRSHRKTQKQMFLLVFGGHFVPLKGTPTWRLHTKLYKFGCRHQNAVKYIASKSFLFILLKEKLDLTLFRVRRSQYFISQTRSLIFNGRLEHDTAASSKKVTRSLSIRRFWGKGERWKRKSPLP